MEANRRKRYVVLPGTGISDQSMESAIFDQAQSGRRINKILSEVSDRRTWPGNVNLSSAEPSTRRLENRIQQGDYEVVQQRFADGPAMVMMTESAKLALEASLPDVRVVPVTRYYLPGQNPRGKRTMAAALPSGKPADFAGGVFLNDVKAHVMDGLSLPPHPRGGGVRVGIVDTGVDATHPALAPAIALERCYVPGADPHAQGPVNWGPDGLARAGHGTHVAGIIAAQAGHGGPEGVAPDAEIVSYRVFPDNPDGPKGAENIAIIDSIRAAIDDGCHIINLSLEGPRLREDGVRSAIADAWNQGVVCIAAAGNGFGNPVSYPAALQHCIAVTAVGREGAFPQDPAFTQFVSQARSVVDPMIFLASFSNYGPPVQFTAPGHAIVSTFPTNSWWIESGTSMAAPFVTGILARLLSGNFGLLNALGDARRSSDMLQMLVATSNILGMPQTTHEGYGLPA